MSYEPEQSVGGSQLMWQQLNQQLDPSVHEQVAILLCTMRGWAPDGRRTVLWQHLNVDQPNVSFLRDGALHDHIDRFVFVSQWQADRYERAFATPRERSVVLANAIQPIEEHDKPSASPVNVVYASTPWRGLDVLLDAWERLQPQDAELNVFSSCKLYGRRFGENDARFGHLYDKARSLDGVQYQGIVPNTQLRDELKKTHVYAYPSTFEETSCISVIEAMAAGCHVVTNDLGALPETCAGFAQMYGFVADHESHVGRFVDELAAALERARRPANRSRQVAHFHERHSWSGRAEEWRAMLAALLGGSPRATSAA